MAVSFQAIAQGALLAGVVSCAGVVFAHHAEIQKRPDEDQVRRLISETSPYRDDRSLILSQLAELRAKQESSAAQLDGVARDVALAASDLAAVRREVDAKLQTTPSDVFAKVATLQALLERIEGALTGGK